MLSRFDRWHGGVYFRAASVDRVKEQFRIGLRIILSNANQANQPPKSCHSVADRARGNFPVGLGESECPARLRPAAEYLPCMPPRFYSCSSSVRFIFATTILLNLTFLLTLASLAWAESAVTCMLAAAVARWKHRSIINNVSNTIQHNPFFAVELTEKGQPILSTATVQQTPSIAPSVSPTM